jgi:hypothetical protein
VARKSRQRAFEQGGIVKRIRLRELPNWPPAPGGAYASGTEFPMGGEATATELVPAMGTSVTFRGTFRGAPHSYHFVAPNEKIAEKVHEVIGGNLGKTVSQLGDLEIEVEESAAKAWKA